MRIPSLAEQRGCSFPFIIWTQVCCVISLVFCFWYEKYCNVLPRKVQAYSLCKCRTWFCCPYSGKIPHWLRGLQISYPFITTSRWRIWRISLISKCPYRDNLQSLKQFHVIFVNVLEVLKLHRRPADKTDAFRSGTYQLWLLCSQYQQL